MSRVIEPTASRLQAPLRPGPQLLVLLFSFFRLFKAFLFPMRFELEYMLSVENVELAEKQREENKNYVSSPLQR